MTFENFAPGRHAVERDGDVVTAASGVHLARDVAAKLGFQHRFDEEEEVFVGAVVDRGCDARPIQSVQRADEQILFVRGKNACLASIRVCA